MDWMMRTRDYLTTHFGADFCTMGVLDESEGRYVRRDKILNKFLVRHLKLTLKLEVTNGEIGRFLYERCRDLLQASDFWTSGRGQVVFFYGWG